MSRVQLVATLLVAALCLMVNTVSHPGLAHGEPLKVTRTLVLYDTSGQWGYFGELYAQMVGNLATRFGTYDAQPVTAYQSGQMSGYDGVVYIGSTNDEPLPPEFLDDVLADTTRVLWLGDNLPQLHNRAAVDGIPGFFIHQYGWQYRAFDTRRVTSVTYKGRDLDRDAANNAAGIMDVIVDEHSPAATVLARANAEDGTSFPWAIRSGHLTYIGEVPLSYISETDRYLILADLLFDLLDPGAIEAHRALLRIEDVSPQANPANLRAIADLLHQRQIPFSVGVIPVFLDPNGNGQGVEKRVTLADRPEVVAALEYMVERGATLIQHGYTHQFGTQPNPYRGVTGEDFEFFAAHVDQATDNVVMTGPVPGDSEQWALGRMDAGGSAMLDAGLPVPGIFEFPHYAASAEDYAAASVRYAARYERALYVSGLANGTGPDYRRFLGQFFPYEVTDVHGSRVIPENLGNVNLAGYNNHPPTLPAEIIDRAARNLVVRDGFASFFFHSFLDPALLIETLDGITALGYRFVSPAEVLSGFPGAPVTPPAAPADVRVEPASDSALVQVVTDPAEEVRPHAFRYSLDADTAWIEVPANPDNTFLLTGLSPGSAHSVTVAAVNVVGHGPAFGPVTFSLDRSDPPGPVPSQPADRLSPAPANPTPPVGLSKPGPPKKPAKLRARATTKSLTARWRPVATADRYRVLLSGRLRGPDHRTVRSPAITLRGRSAKGARLRLCVTAINAAGFSRPACIAVRVG